MPNALDVLCFSHLRWNFVFQRPQHLLTRCAREHRVFFFEEPQFGANAPTLELTRDVSGVTVAVPHLPHDMLDEAVTAALRHLLDDLVRSHHLDAAVHWYYTPMALGFSRHLRPAAVVYDCMDELSGFAGAPAGIVRAERALLSAADVVFTGGQSLFEAKRHLHANIHAFPSSVDVPHFARARHVEAEQPDQAAIPRPRAGFFGVLDERLDRDLLARAAALRPDWQFVLIGPVVKIDPASLPAAPNLHYLGPKTYAELPEYIAGWDVALLPFARNDATRFISPTKTPEYLAAGRPVVSTSIRDVVRPYGDLDLAYIADEPVAFVEALDRALHADAGGRIAAADAFLSRTSWHTTWEAMRQEIEKAIAARRTLSRSRQSAYPHRHPDPGGTSASA